MAVPVPPIIDPTTAERLVDMMISASLFTAKCATDQSHGCVVVWSANALEQIQTFLEREAMPK